MNDEPIFIFGQPRSGTTMLMRVLNATPGVRIYGEHGGAAYYLGLIHRSLCKDHVVDYNFNITDEQAEQVLASGKEWCNNIGGIQTDTIRDGLRTMVQAIGNPFNKQVRWGFKEVNIVGRELIDALVELYPKCKIILVNRNPYNSILSAKRLGWCRDVQEALTYWNMRTESFEYAAKTYPDNCKLWRYEDIGPLAIGDILRWVGIKLVSVEHTEAFQTRVGEAPKCDLGFTEEERLIISTGQSIYSNEFEQVYANGGWDGKGSGVGSDRNYCVAYNAWLESYLRQHEIKSVLDVGCGDWQSSRWINWGVARYTGIDVVYDVISRNRILFSGNGVDFIYGDALVDPLPAADLLIVKDVIHHLKHPDVRRMVEISKKYPRVLWVVDMGKDVPHGAWPCVDLMSYFKPLPILFTFDNPPGYPYGRKVVLEAINSESASIPAISLAQEPEQPPQPLPAAGQG